jgi:hypothetical protein
MISSDSGLRGGKGYEKVPIIVHDVLFAGQCYCPASSGAGGFTSIASHEACVDACRYLEIDTTPMDDETKWSPTWTSGVGTSSTSAQRALYMAIVFDADREHYVASLKKMYSDALRQCVAEGTFPYQHTLAVVSDLPPTSITLESKIQKEEATEAPISTKRQTGGAVVIDVVS